jgi:hypothetical protein
VPHAKTKREQSLRHYLAAFGVEVAPRVEGERARTAICIAEVLQRIAAERKKRPSVVHVWAPPPAPDSPIVRAVQRLRARRIEVRWSIAPLEESVGPTADGIGDEPATTVREAVEEAVRVRARASRVRGELALRKMGILRARRFIPEHS